MAKGYVLYNKKAGNNRDNEDYKLLDIVFDKELKFIDMEEIKDYKDFLSSLEENDFITICGGDGTLNFFVNATEGVEFQGDIYYFPRGTGNDFAHDLGHKKECAPFLVTEYLKNLPYVIVKGKKYRFLNGVGFGIDGYCCEVGDEIKKKSDKAVNYTAIAIKGLLFHYKPTNAKVTVDGIEHTYKKVWIAPTMNGRFYGGGMMPTPEQKRNEEDGQLSVMVLYGSSKLKTLLAFPSIFKGEHIKHTEMVEIIKGRKIIVEFDRPASLQIDGETILGVTSYTAEK